MTTHYTHVPPTMIATDIMHNNGMSLVKMNAILPVLGQIPCTVETSLLHVWVDDLLPFSGALKVWHSCCRPSPKLTTAVLLYSIMFKMLNTQQQQAVRQQLGCQTLNMRDNVHCQQMTASEQQKQSAPPHNSCAIIATGQLVYRLVWSKVCT
jgi:hypothetical protein